MAVKPVTVVLACLGCCLFPCIVMLMVLTYEQQTDWAEPGPFPCNFVQYVFYADFCYSAILIVVLKGHRTLAAVIAAPLVLVTAVMTFFAGLWFSGNYL
jgi:hypothetical protein